ncbi:ABC transporter permease subunit [Marivirga tractuosa]|uniref:ABC transporter permease subunit n=1 Tax=Marivirga tractuosa TaxID=1006 RepID=UPI0035CF9ED8
MFKIAKFITADLLKNKVMLLYLIFLWAVCFGLFSLQGQGDKALTGILNVSLLVTPMICLIFATIYFYNMYEFMMLMHAQPIKRKTLFMALYLSLAIVFTCIYLLGAGIPLLIMNAGAASIFMIIGTTFLNFIFVALALGVAVWTKDKSKGMGFSLLIWVYFVLLFDGIILLLMYNFSDYPIEKLVLYISFLNPVDLMRILVLMQTEAAALMGYSGAIFQKVFTENWGISIIFLVMVLWSIIPLGFSLRAYNKKDL